MIKIHDIKPIVEISDFSIYLYYGLILLLIVLLSFIIYLIYKFFKPKEKSQDKLWFEELQNLDLNNIKDSAYSISKYGRYLAKDERQIRLIDELVDELSEYKYKKEIPSKFTQEIKTKLTIFMDTIDV